MKMKVSIPILKVIRVIKEKRVKKLFLKIESKLDKIKWR